MPDDPELPCDKLPPADDEEMRRGIEHDQAVAADPFGEGEDGTLPGG